MYQRDIGEWGNTGTGLQRSGRLRDWMASWDGESSRSGEIDNLERVSEALREMRKKEKD